MTDVEVSDVLVRGFDMLTEIGFTTGAFARDAQGRVCGANDDGVVSLCSVGALFRASRELDVLHGYSDASDALRSVVCPNAITPFGGLVEWSDNNSWATVRKGWLTAIARAQRAEKAIQEVELV